jgi:hypothetical protein
MNAVTAPVLSKTPISYASVMRGDEAALWEEESALELERLIDTSQTMRPITALPPGRTAAYYNPQVKMKVKADGTIKRRVRGTIGGDRVDYPGIVTANTAALDTVKILLNAVVSEDAHWATVDITDFYLGTPLDRSEYMRIPERLVPDRLKARLLSRGLRSVLMQIDKGIYGLPQAGRLAQERLVAHLCAHGFHPAASTTCLC